MNVVACSMVAAAIALLAGRLAPCHPTTRVPTAAQHRLDAHAPGRPGIAERRLVAAFVATGALVAVAGVAVAGCDDWRVVRSSWRGGAGNVRSLTAGRSPPRCPTRSSSSC